MDSVSSQKSHHARKPNKRDKKKQPVTDSERKKNPKSAVAAKRARQRNSDIEHKKHHVPLVNRSLELDVDPPVLVAVVGPPKVGKSTLIRSLVKHYTGHNIPDVKGPLSLVSGKKRRLTFIECPNNLHAMCDIAKSADLILLLVDAAFGFEMETFEFLNIAQTHGFPKVMGVLTHLDSFKSAKTLRLTKKRLKARFWTEVYDGAKLFYLSGIKNNAYSKTEIHNLARFISVMKFRPLIWRNTHSYLLADRFEDITDPHLISSTPLCNRSITLYGYLRGTVLKPTQKVHLLGVGDFDMTSLTVMPDPCPLPGSIKRSLVQREKKLYAPMTDIGDMIYDADGIYVRIRDHQVSYSDPSKALSADQDPELRKKKIVSTKEKNFGSDDEDEPEANDSSKIVLGSGPGEIMVRNLQHIQSGFDEKMQESTFRMFKDSQEISGKDLNDENSESEDDESEDSEVEALNSSSKNQKKSVEMVQDSGRIRRRVVFEKDVEIDENDMDEDDNDEAEINSENESDELAFDNEEEAEEYQLDKQLLERLSGKDLKKEFVHDSVNKDEHLTEKVKSKSWSRNEIPESKDLNEESEDLSGDEESESGSGKEDDESVQTKRVPMSKKPNLMELVYGDNYSNSKQSKSAKQTAAVNADSSDDDEFFKPKNSKKQSTESNYNPFSEINATDSSKNIDSEILKQISANNSSEYVSSILEDESLALLKEKFVTGSWGKGENAEDGENPVEQALDPEEVFGDWEDVESGATSKPAVSTEEANDDALDAELADVVSGITVQDDGPRKLGESKKDAHDRRMKAKLALKKNFDSSYDGGKEKTDENDDGDQYEAWKVATEKQAKFNNEEFDGEDEAVRLQQVGARQGQYVRVELRNVPCEFVKNFDLSQPLVVGALLSHEHALGFIQVRIKKHRWHKKILKNNDPIIFSIGWRRFQSIPVFSLEDRGGRQRMIKYTPEHMHCIATFYGPVTPPGSGILAFQNSAANNTKFGFRISATGVILELNASFRIVKKLKLTGVPYEIHRNTAFIKDMFNSELEVAKFENASLRTVSGIRGQVKKALTGQKGKFRATFEDKILMSDIVFCRTWTTVEPKQYYNPVSSLLTKDWKGMRTVSELRRDSGIPIPVKKDSVYTDIVRHERKFNPLKLPQSLVKSLPYASKPKLETAKKRKSYEDKRKVVPDAQETKTMALLQAAHALRNEKMDIRKAAELKRRENSMRLKGKEDQQRNDSLKVQKKRKFMAQGKKDKHRKLNDGSKETE